MTAPRLTVMLSARGGTGRSILAANLALALMRRNRQPVWLWDADDLTGGFQADAFDLQGAHPHWGEPLRHGQPLAGAVVRHASGLDLLPAPPIGWGTPLEAVSLATRVREVAAAHVVVDLSGVGLAEHQLAWLDLASSVVLLVTPDIPSLTATRHLLEHLRTQHAVLDRLMLVVNRSGLVQDISPRDVAQELGLELVQAVPFEPAVVSALNRGVPLLAAATPPSTPFGKAMLALAQAVQAPPARDWAAMGRKPVVRPVTRADQDHPAEASVALVPVETAWHEGHAEVRQRLHRMLVEELKRMDVGLDRLSDPQHRQEIRRQVQRTVADLIEDLPEAAAMGREERGALARDLTDEAVGYGPLERFLADPAISEIMVNGPGRIFVEREGRLQQVHDRFTDETQLRVVIDRIVAPLGRRVDESSPMCDARLPDGSRVNVIIPPLALRGATITIRKFPLRRLTMDHLVQYGSLTPEMAGFLRQCVRARLNVFISGGTGSGKTTLLNVLSSFIPDEERIVTIEDAAELQLAQSHVVPLEARPANLEGVGAVPIRDLVRNSLRMRPDRIVVGEVRGGEALDMLQAMNTGHDGSLATGHANSPRDAMARIETMVLMAGMDLPVRAIREQIASALHVVVQVSRLADGSRKITRITEVTGLEGETLTLQDLYSFEQTGVDAGGRVQGAFRASGLRPQFAEVFERSGVGH